MVKVIGCIFFVDDLLFVYYCVIDFKILLWVCGVFFVVFVYFVFLIDMIFDFIVVFGFIDDVIVIVIMFGIVGSYVKRCYKECVRCVLDLLFYVEE